MYKNVKPVIFIAQPLNLQGIAQLMFRRSET